MEIILKNGFYTKMALDACDVIIKDAYCETHSASFDEQFVAECYKPATRKSTMVVNQIKHSACGVCWILERKTPNG